MRARLAPLEAILDAHGVEHETVTSSDPGLIIDADPWQVGVVPWDRMAPTPLDPSVTFTKTTAGSKRAFARARRSGPSVDTSD